MSLFISSLNSGSNGNCYYIGNAQEAVLVDAGISCLETEKRMKRLGLGFDKVKAIFISHEHADHIRGVEVLSRKYSLPVYITPKTKLNSRLALEKHLTKPFCATRPVQIGGLEILAFPKLHDAIEPHSFVIGCNHIKVGIFTDIGFACKQLIHHFKQCHAAFLEANYDDEMLVNGRYPYHLKHRIRGGKGHLSNAQALQVFKEHKPDFMGHLLLSHLSKDNNCPKLVQQLFECCANGTEIIVASRDAETAVYLIDGSFVKKQTSNKPTAKEQSKMQLSLF
ncbi:MAG: MBL fold metallo-hydrolase [Mucilaginibacter sp.]|uniref:MBL fold metallo-hydrolase n=1 Tax=Mucilaginibacter sp. TaxID=1882438 RepID=UPI0034E533B5